MIVFSKKHFLNGFFKFFFFENFRSKMKAKFFKNVVKNGYCRKIGHYKIKLFEPIIKQKLITLGSNVLEFVQRFVHIFVPKFVFDGKFA